ncbi:hypothetical protein Cgig2_023538 [Carnegiea gigantea]|uniref:Uncharacterized protein n=1 Tax=Carnegiea gigantea TaxID=171969 RepID=A0A9Q1JI78_9CARY|nr:hypothetical protein Cgig2_023538 [Carnegiea gigantea]
MYQKIDSTSEASRESPSNGNNEDLARSSQRNEDMINRSILPRDVMNYKEGVRFCVAFNNYNQPIRKGGYIFMRFLGYIARLERFCPIGMISWHKLNQMYKADIIEMIRSRFMYPTDKGFNKRVLKHVAKHFKQHRQGLKRDYFKPEERLLQT